MKSLYIATMDRGPAYFDGEQMVFARGGENLLEIGYNNLSLLHKDIERSEQWRKERGFSHNDFSYSYWRVKI